MAKKKKISLKKRILSWKTFKILLQVFFVFITLAALLFFTVYFGFWGRIPDENELKSIRNNLASEVYSNDGVLLGKYYIENRSNIDFQDIPQFVFDALISTEDARFYQHDGVDRRGLARVFFKSILLGKRSSGGGSTISQQLAKNLYPRKDHVVLKMPVNKFREIIIASRLEKVWHKDSILMMYLNTVPFGDNTYGISSAAEHYFSKKPNELNIEEAAVLVGMLKATWTYNPYLHPEAATRRRNTVLAQMEKYGYLKQEEARKLQEKPLKIKYRVISHDTGPATYFRMHIKPMLLEWCENNPKADGSKWNLYTDGLKIYTTIDSKLQFYAESALQNHMRRLQADFDRHTGANKPWEKNDHVIQAAMMSSDRYQSLLKAGKPEEEIQQEFNIPRKTRVFSWKGEQDRVMTPLDSIKYYLGILNAGFVALDPYTGSILAWTGGIDYKFFQYDQVTARRQTGSTFKPIVYAAALEKGVKPCDYFANDSVVYGRYDNWSPRNAEGNYGGKYSVTGGLVHSVNTVSVEILMKTRIRNVIGMSRDMGITEGLPEVPSLALGTGEVSLLNMTRAYATFVNEGSPVASRYITRIEDAKGNELARFHDPGKNKPVMSPETAREMIYMLEQVVDSGTAAGLRHYYGLGFDIGGKTGTTQSHADGWFIGFTPDIVAGVRVGGQSTAVHFSSLALGQGSYMALPIWGEFAREARKDKATRYRFSNSFYPLTPDMADRFNCPHYKEEEHKVRDFFRDLFGGSDKEEPADTSKTNRKNVIDKIRRFFKKK
ncbi:MAG: penicillin-binding protein 1A [Bacteroidales bacterium]